MSRVVLAVIIALAASAAYGEESKSLLSLRSEDGEAELVLGGLVQLWACLHEEVENGLRQAYSHDNAVDEASGFSFRRVRFYSLANFYDGLLKAKFEIRFEGGGPGLLDAWAAWDPLDGALKVMAGQMKIPSTYEVERSSAELDFANRSFFSENVTEWSLSRAAAMASPFSGVKTYMRDLGLAVKGELGGFDYFFMLGNGLGANAFIGGRERKGRLFTNAFGAWFYGAAVSVDLFEFLKKPAAGFPLRCAEVGGHYCVNLHHDSVLSDERTTVDLVRRSWSLHIRTDILGRVRVTAMLGGGAIRDDFDHDGKDDYAYSGWEIKVMGVILLDRLEVGFRVDSYEDERLESGDVKTRRTYSFVINFSPIRHLRFQLHYQIKTLTSETELDLDDNCLLLSGQFRF